MAEQNTGPELFAAFLEEHGITQLAASAAIGVSAPTVHDWIAETKRPRTHHRQAIEVWTGGEVPASSWETEAERGAVANVVPFDGAASLAADGTEG